MHADGHAKAKGKSLTKAAVRAFNTQLVLLHRVGNQITAVGLKGLELVSVEVSIGVKGGEVTKDRMSLA